MYRFTLRHAAGLALVASMLTPGLSFAETNTTMGQIASVEAQLRIYEGLVQQLKTRLAELRTSASSTATTTAHLPPGLVKKLPKFACLALGGHLRHNARGNDIINLQTFLAQFPEYYPEGKVSGYFGIMTSNAVKRFQKSHGLEETGEVGPKTRQKIKEWTCVERNGKLFDRDHDGDDDDDDDKDDKKHGTSTPVVDTTAPVLSNILASQVMRTSALISWKTDDKAAGAVYYSTSTPTEFTPLFAKNMEKNTSHEFMLTGLAPYTTYFFLVASTNKAGLSATSSVQNFTTMQ